MKAVLEKLIQYETLTQAEAKAVLMDIGQGQCNSHQIAAFLTTFMMRTVTVEELSGFRSALLDLCVAIDLSAYNPIDLCGTGGDGKDTFNISTLASFVTAGAGVKVAKHGNYGVSSSCGSSNVMEHLGVKFSNDAVFLEQSIDQAGICILHAPLFHPAMKHVAPVRRELGLKTFFNMLGPLVNPAFPKQQMVGVFNLELLRIYSYLLEETEQRYSIIHALDGYDEISLTGEAKVASNNDTFLVDAKTFGLTPLQATDIGGGESVEDAAQIFLNVLSGQSTLAQRQVVCANAAVAISTAKEISLQDGFAAAEESLDSGHALSALQTLQKLSA
ncbi:MAG: anthranilate phosphoribosyltransferase [Flavobacteriaceae bacterium]